MGVDEHTIYFDESPVYYRSAGPTGVPPVYVHGIPTSSDDWVAFLERSGGYAPDLIGFGRSGKGGHLDYSLAGLAAFLERLLAELSVDRLTLVGHDYGAAVALTFARRNPERVTRLVLCSAPPLLGGFEFPRLIRLWRTPGIGEMLMGSTARWMLARALRHGSVNPEAWPDSRVAAVWDQFDQGTQRAILLLVRSASDNMIGGSGGAGATEPARATEPTGATEPTPATQPAPALDPPPPTLILWGERDPWYPPELAGAYATLLPGAKVERLSDAGHWPWLDRPDVVDTVVRFLEE